MKIEDNQTANGSINIDIVAILSSCRWFFLCFQSFYAKSNALYIYLRVAVVFYCMSVHLSSYFRFVPFLIRFTECDRITIFKWLIEVNGLWLLRKFLADDVWIERSDDSSMRLTRHPLFTVPFLFRLVWFWSVFSQWIIATSHVCESWLWEEWTVMQIRSEADYD